MKFSSVQLLSRVWLFVTPWTAACQASLSIADSWNWLKLMSIESVMPSNHLILCRPLLLPLLIFPSIRVFSNESVLWIRWPKYWSFTQTPMKTQWRHFFFHMMKTFSLIIFSIVFLSVLAKNSVLKVIIDCLEMSTSLERKNNDNDGN